MEAQPQDLPAALIPSKKKYATAVCLAAVFGILGIHHFYLGRWIHGAVDLSLSLCAYIFYLQGNLGLALAVFAVDYLHTIIITILLLIGAYKDGNGHPVCYPGQKLS